MKDCKIKVGDADIVTPGLDTEIGDDLEVVIQRVTTSQETVEEDVDFNTIEKDDPSMEEGKSKVETEGSKGRDKGWEICAYLRADAGTERGPPCA